MAFLSATERSEFLSHHPGWQIDGETLRKTFTHKDFVAALGFVTQVAMLAEKAYHHPDLDIRWNKVSISLSTHDEGGLTMKDAALAEAIDQLTERGG